MFMASGTKSHKFVVITSKLEKFVSLLMKVHLSLLQIMKTLCVTRVNLRKALLDGSTLDGLLKV